MKLLSFYNVLGKIQITANFRLYKGQDFTNECPPGTHEVEGHKEGCDPKRDGDGKRCPPGSIGYECEYDRVGFRKALRNNDTEKLKEFQKQEVDKCDLCRTGGLPFPVDSVIFNPCKCTPDCTPDCSEERSSLEKRFWG